jgi:hypothetical protein
MVSSVGPGELAPALVLEFLAHSEAALLAWHREN